MALIPQMKRLFAEQRYAEVIELGDPSFTTEDSELCLLLSESALALTAACIHKGKMQSAAAYLEKLQHYSAVLPYGNGHILCAVELFSAILRNVQVPKYNLQASSFPALLNQTVYTDLFYYLSEQDAGYTYYDPTLAALSEGRRLMAAGRYSDAIRHFEILEEAKSNRDTSLFLLFRLYGELETCHKELRNFEYAYRYAAKRLSLISAFRS
jgi:tetratricopeptide (TPR) repeat protein